MGMHAPPPAMQTGLGCDREGSGVDCDAGAGVDAILVPLHGCGGGV